MGHLRSREVGCPAQSHAGTDSCYSNPSLPQTKMLSTTTKDRKERPMKRYSTSEVLSLLATPPLCFYFILIFIFTAPPILSFISQDTSCWGRNSNFIWKTRWLRRWWTSVPKNNLPKLEFRFFYTESAEGVVGCCKLLGTGILCSCSCLQHPSGNDAPVNL